LSISQSNSGDADTLFAADYNYLKGLPTQGYRKSKRKIAATLQNITDARAEIKREVLGLDRSGNQSRPERQSSYATRQGSNRLVHLGTQPLHLEHYTGDNWKGEVWFTERSDGIHRV